MKMSPWIPCPAPNQLASWFVTTRHPLFRAGYRLLLQRPGLALRLVMTHLVSRKSQHGWIFFKRGPRGDKVHVQLPLGSWNYRKGTGALRCVWRCVAGVMATSGMSCSKLLLQKEIRTHNNSNNCQVFSVYCMIRIQSMWCHNVTAFHHAIHRPLH